VLAIEAAAEDEWWQSLLHVVPGAGRQGIERPQRGWAGAVDGSFDLTEQLVIRQRRGNGARPGGVRAACNPCLRPHTANRQLMHEMFGENADEERYGDGASRSNPTPYVPCGGTHALVRVSDGEGNHTRWPAEMIDFLHDPRMLTGESFGRERVIGFVDDASRDIAERR
jgi:hypothetical protein